MKKFDVFFAWLPALLFACSACAAAPDTPVVYGAGADAYGQAGAVLTDNDLLFMTWPSRPNTTNRWLVAVDATTPRSPVLLSRMAIDGFPQGIAKRGDNLFLVNGLDFIVVNASNPRDMKIAARLNIAPHPAQGPQSLALKGDTAFLACRLGGIGTVDISKPLAPRQARVCALPGYARAVAVAGDCLYACMDNQGLQVLKIDGAGALQPVFRMPAPEGSIMRAALRADAAVMAAGHTLVACALLNDPARPAWAGSVSDRGHLSPFFGAHAHDVVLLDDGVGLPNHKYACIADGESGLVVVDVTEPAAPGFVAGFSCDAERGVITSLAARGNVVFANDETFGLRAADVGDPTRPVWLGKGLKLAQ